MHQGLCSSVVRSVGTEGISLTSYCWRANAPSRIFIPSRLLCDLAIVDCQAHLLSLGTGVSPEQVILRLKKKCEILVAGVPHGWIHKPHRQDANQLLAHEWNLFMLTDATYGLSEQDADIIDHLQIDLSITEEQHESLSFARTIEPRPMPSTPPLPSEWTNSSTGNLEIPKRHDLGPTTSPLALESSGWTMG